MTSYLSKQLNEILENGDDESIINWVFDHRQDILNAFDAWSKPTGTHFHNWITTGEHGEDAYCATCGKQAEFPD